MSEKNRLPEGWAQTTLDEIVIPVRVSVRPSENPDLPYIGMEHIESNTMRLIGTADAGEMKSNARSFVPGDVLYGRLRPYLNKVYQPNFQGLCSAEFIVLSGSLSAADGRYLRYFLNSRPFVLFASRLHTGDRPRVDWDQLKTFPLDLPPLAEQRRIVAAIEEQFSRLEAGVVALERAQANLKRYRAAVLKAAVEGRLTEAWREENPDAEPASELLERILKERRERWEKEQLATFEKKGKKPTKDWRAKYEEPVRPNTEDLPELSEGWCWASLPQIGRFDRGKSKHRPRNARHLYGGPYPFIQTSDVRHADTFIRDYQQTYSEAGLQQSRLWPAGTLCITIAANIAETGILTFDACFPDSVVGLLASPQHVSTQFVEIYLRTIRERLETYAPATAQKNINIETLKQVAVTFPPKAEQEQIVVEVERRLSVLRKVEAEVETDLKRASTLRQSVLKRAFEGRLVSQDPSDEPASQLLDKIKAEREQAAEVERKSKRERGSKRKRVNVNRVRRPLQEVLFEARAPLEPEALFERAGYEAESAEEFFEELQREVSSNHIEELRPNSKDVYLKAVSE